MLLSYLKKQLHQNGEVYLRVKARPNAAITTIKEVLADETVKIDVAAPAERGRANAELTAFLAREFAVSKNSVRIVSGVSERTKLVKIINTHR